MNVLLVTHCINTIAHSYTSSYGAPQLYTDLQRSVLTLFVLSHLWNKILIFNRMNTDIHACRYAYTFVLCMNKKDSLFYRWAAKLPDLQYQKHGSYHCFLFLPKFANSPSAANSGSDVSPSKWTIISVWGYWHYKCFLDYTTWLYIFLSKLTCNCRLHPQ